LVKLHVFTTVRVSPRYLLRKMPFLHSAIREGRRRISSRLVAVGVLTDLRLLIYHLVLVQVDYLLSRSCLNMLMMMDVMDTAHVIVLTFFTGC
jgi:hypothetical protein